MFQTTLSPQSGNPNNLYAGSLAEIHNNDLSGASGIRNCRPIKPRDNSTTTSAPWSWNGLWLIGSFDVDAQNITITDVARESVVQRLLTGDNPMLEGFTL